MLEAELSNHRRPQTRWLRAAVVGTIVLVVLLLYLRHTGCLAYWRSKHIAGFLAFPSLFTLMFVGLRWKGRIMLAVSVLIVALFALPPHTNPMPIAAAESSAVKTLLQIHASLEAGKSENRERGFARILPAITTGFPVQRFYRFDYLPELSSDGSIKGFRITATLLPGARSCGCIRNFLITSDGTVRYTMENRSATSDDAIVEIPVSSRYGPAGVKR